MTIDVSALPPDLKAVIDKAVADALAANQPAPPKELTAAEKAVAFLASGEAAERADRAIPSGSATVHAAIFAVLHLLVDKVYPPEPEPATAQPAVTVTAPVTYTEFAN